MEAIPQGASGKERISGELAMEIGELQFLFLGHGGAGVGQISGELAMEIGGFRSC